MTNPSLATVLREAIASGLSGLRVSMPAKVVKFDAPSQTAQVQVGPGDLPIISAVPVLFDGGGGYAVTFPVAAGDPCLLVFTDVSLDEWAAGIDGAPSDPRTHSLMDCVAILGVRSDKTKLTDFDTGRMVVGNHGPRIALDGSTVHLGVDHGASAGQSLLRGDAYLAAEDSWTQAQETWQSNLATALTALGSSLTALGSAPVLSAALGTLINTLATAVSASNTSSSAAGTTFRTRATQKTDKAKVP